MKRKAIIWSEGQYVITKHTDNIVLDINTQQIYIITESEKDFDLTINNKKYKIVSKMDVFSLSNLAKLFQSRVVATKLKGEYNEKGESNRI